MKLTFEKHCTICDKITYYAENGIYKFSRSHYSIFLDESGLKEQVDLNVDICKECFEKAAGKQFIELINKKKNK